MSTMNFFLLIAFTVLLCSTVSAQETIKLHYEKISPTEFKRYKSVEYLIKDPAVRKENEGFLIPIPGMQGKGKIYRDHNDGETNVTVDYLGNILNTTYYLISRKRNEKITYELDNSTTHNGSTLIGIPIMSADLKHFVCISDDTTYIQFGALEDKILCTKPILNEFPKRIGITRCNGPYSFVSKDPDGNFWRIRVSNP